MHILNENRDHYEKVKSQYPYIPNLSPRYLELRFPDVLLLDR
jgi:hypothetical protein